jgi:hypothetical protein
MFEYVPKCYFTKLTLTPFSALFTYFNITAAKMQNESIFSEQLPKQRKTFRARGSRGGARKKRGKVSLVNHHSETRHGHYDRCRENYCGIYRDQIHNSYNDEVKEYDSSNGYKLIGGVTLSSSRFMKDDEIKTLIFQDDLNQCRQSQNESAHRISNLHNPSEIFHEKTNLIHLDENKSTNPNISDSHPFLSQFLSIDETFGGRQCSVRTACEDNVNGSTFSEQSYFRTSPRSFLMGRKKVKSYAIDKTWTFNYDINND